MANQYVTAKLIAERALPHLVERIKLLPLVTRGIYDGTFRKAGDTIQVKKPLRGNTTDGSVDISSAFADVQDESVEIVLNRQRTYPVNISSKEMTLNIDDFDRQVTQPAVTKLAEDINNDLLGLYVDIPYFSGTSGTTPSDLASIADARKVLQENLAPEQDRAYVFDSTAEAKYLILDTFAEVDKSGTNEALRNATLGRVYNMILASDSMITSHVAGAYTALTDVTITAGALGATTITLTSTAGTSTDALKAGDIFTLDGNQYTVTADTANAVAGVVSVGIYPALPKAFGDMDSVAVAFADETAGAHVPNLMFQKDAFTLAMAPLEEPMGGADSAVIQFEGFAIRVVMDYAFNTDKNVIRYDILYGVKTTYPELAVRVLG